MGCLPDSPLELPPAPPTPGSALAPIERSHLPFPTPPPWSFSTAPGADCRGPVPAVPGPPPLQAPPGSPRGSPHPAHLGAPHSGSLTQEQRAWADPSVLSRRLYYLGLPSANQERLYLTRSVSGSFGWASELRSPGVRGRLTYSMLSFQTSLAGSPLPRPRVSSQHSPCLRRDSCTPPLPRGPRPACPGALAPPVQGPLALPSQALPPTPPPPRMQCPVAPAPGYL